MAAVQGLLAASSGAADENASTTPAPMALDVGPGRDLSQLVALRAKNQSREAADSVRVSWKMTPEEDQGLSQAEPIKKAASERQLLAKKINDAIKLNAEQGSSTGLNRQVRWGKNAAGSAAVDGSTTGNSANAHAAARSGATAVSEKIFMK